MGITQANALETTFNEELKGRRGYKWGVGKKKSKERTHKNVKIDEETQQIEVELKGKESLLAF